MGSSTSAYSNPYASTSSGKGGSSMYGGGGYNPYINRSNYGGSGMYGGGSKGGTSPSGGNFNNSLSYLSQFPSYGSYNPYYGGGSGGKGGALTPTAWEGDLNDMDWTGWRPQQIQGFGGPMVSGYYNPGTGEYINFQDPQFGAFDNAYNAYYQTYDPDVTYYEPDPYGWNMSTGWYNPTTGEFLTDQESDQWSTVSEGYRAYQRALRNYQMQQFQNWYGGFPGKGGGNTNTNSNNPPPDDDVPSGGHGSVSYGGKHWTMDANGSFVDSNGYTISHGHPSYAAILDLWESAYGTGTHQPPPAAGGNDYDVLFGNDANFRVGTDPALSGMYVPIGSEWISPEWVHYVNSSGLLTNEGANRLNNMFPGALRFRWDENGMNPEIVFRAGT